MSHEGFITHKEHEKAHNVHRLTGKIVENEFRLSEAIVEHLNKHANAHLEPHDVMCAIEDICRQEGGFVGNLETQYLIYIGKDLQARTPKILEEARACEGDADCIENIINTQRERIASLPLTVDTHKLLQDFRDEIWQGAFATTDA